MPGVSDKIKLDVLEHLNEILELLIPKMDLKWKRKNSYEKTE